MKRLTFALLLILLGGLAACRTAGNSQPVNVATKQIDPCSLITKAQVEQVLKAQVTATQGSPIPNSNARYISCDYANWGFSVSANISLEIYKDVANATAAFEEHRHMIIIVSMGVDGTPPPSDVHVTFQNLSGLGDQAVLIITPQHPILYVQKGNVILSINTGNYKQPVAQSEQQEQELARLAVRNM